MCRSHRIGQSKTVHVYRLVSTGTMERMIYEQQMKKVNLSISVVDNDASNTSAATQPSLATALGVEAAPFSGFLQPPSAPDQQSHMIVEESLLEDDDVLVSCIQKTGHWLVRFAELTSFPFADSTELYFRWACIPYMMSMSRLKLMAQTPECFTKSNMFPAYGIETARINTITGCIHRTFDRLVKCDYVCLQASPISTNTA